MPLADLPPEILTSIISKTRGYGGRGQLTSCLQVCHEWYVISSSILWCSIHLTNKNLNEFLDVAQQYPEKCHRIRSLSLCLSIEGLSSVDAVDLDDSLGRICGGGTNLRTIRLWRSLERLSEIIEQDVKRLVSFSLVVEQDHCKYHPTSGGWLNSHIVKKLLISLPVSCIDLEVDTNGQEDDLKNGFDPTRQSAHLCVTLRKILPRLRHLRLCLGSYCPGLLGEKRQFTISWVKAPSLQSMMVDLCLGVGRCANSCGALYRKLPNTLGFDLVLPVADNDSVYRPADEEARHRTLEIAIAKTVRLASHGGALPQAKLVQVTNLVISNNMPTAGYFTRQNVLEDETQKLTLLQSSEHIHMVCNEKGQDLWGYFRELEGTVTQGSWHTSLDGSRYSQDLLSLASLEDVGLRQYQVMNWIQSARRLDPGSEAIWTEFLLKTFRLISLRLWGRLKFYLGR